MTETFDEEEILDDLRARGIAHEPEQYDTAGEPCNYCGEPVPENDHKKMNLGLSSGYCDLGCLMNAEADEEGEP